MEYARKRVVAGLIERGKKVLIAQRRKTDIFSGKWEFPGGKVQDGEDDTEALRREIKEELGVRVRVGRKFGEHTYDYKEFGVHLLFFHCRLVGNLEPRPREHRRILWVSSSDLEKYDFLEADMPILPKIKKSFAL